MATLLPLEVLRRCQDGWFVASNYHPGEASEEGGVDKDYLFLHNFNRYYWVVIAPTTRCRYDREKKNRRTLRACCENGDDQRWQVKVLV